MTDRLDTRALSLALISYFSWGFFPIYWHQLHEVPSLEILAHRMIWSTVFYLGVYFSRHGSRALSRLRGQRSSDWWAAASSSALLATNWGVYIHAVNTGQILQGSLAYFLNPLFNVIFGVLFFRESFPWPLRIASGCAALGVAIQVSGSAVFPAFALILAISFSIYGIVKKRLVIPADLSSVMESLCGLLPALLIAGWMAAQRSRPLSPTEILLLIGGGAVTGLPLFLFSHAAQRLPYSLMGILQFIAPTLQFAVGVFLYREPLDSAQIAAFVLIWIGVAIYLLSVARSLFRPAKP